MRVDEETSKVVSAISDILKLKESEENEAIDSASPFKSYDKTESPVSVLKNSPRMPKWLLWNL